jgi:hypothetical protein
MRQKQLEQYNKCLGVKMRRNIIDLDLDELKKDLDYNPETGELKWKQTKSGRAKDKHISGEYIVYKYNHYRISRLIWFMYHQESPDTAKLINHKNGDKNDYRIDNLELVDSQVSSRGSYKKKLNRLRGAYYYDYLGKWKSSICIRSKIVHLGYFKSELEAHEAYMNKLREIENA